MYKLTYFRTKVLYTTCQISDEIKIASKRTDIKIYSLTVPDNTLLSAFSITGFTQITVEEFET